MKSGKLVLCIILGLIIASLGILSVAAYGYQQYHKPYYKQFYKPYYYSAPVLFYGPWYNFGWYNPAPYYFKYYPTRYNYYYAPSYSYGGWGNSWR